MLELFNYSTYIFLFLALFFEVFLILAFFESEAKRRRGLHATGTFPSVSIIVPCYNEENTLKATADSLLALSYPKEKLTVILVDDGSTDETKKSIEQYRGNPQVRIIHKNNGGKHTALNAGIAIADTEFVGCLDADSIVAPDALTELMAQFDDPAIAAVTASMSIHAPRSFLERMQEAEYLVGIAFRHILANVHGLYVTPGPLTVYRKRVFDELGAFRAAHQTEDMEIALRVQKAHLRIQNAPRARVYTKAPQTVAGLLKQRTRWTSGFLRNMMDYRTLFANPAYGVLGLLVLPFAVLSIFSGIFLFCVSLYRIGNALFHFALRASEVPLAFTLHVRSFDWFYVPVNTVVLIALCVGAITLTFIGIGMRISDSRTRFGPMILAYFMIYGVIAALWKIRAVSDVAFGKHRSWR